MEEAQIQRLPSPTAPRTGGEGSAPHTTAFSEQNTTRECLRPLPSLPHDRPAGGFKHNWEGGLNIQDESVYIIYIFIFIEPLFAALLPEEQLLGANAPPPSQAGPPRRRESWVPVPLPLLHTPRATSREETPGALAPHPPSAAPCQAAWKPPPPRSGKRGAGGRQQCHRQRSQGGGN